VHQLLTHDPYFNPAIITSRFVDGLKNEIKSVVLVHRPKDLDTASCLALLQEEVLVGFSSKEVRKQEIYTATKSMNKQFNTVPTLRGAETIVPDDKRNSGQSKVRPQIDKLQALIAYRKAKGLCYKCGLKWGPQHSCPESVSIHVVEELLANDE